MTSTRNSVSSSSDSSSEPDLAKKKKRSLHSRAKYRRRKYVVMEGKTSGDLTLLERKAIGTASEKMYQKELKAFMDYARCPCLNLKEGETMDRLMVQYMNHCYLAGHQAYVGDRLIASWMHHYEE